MNNERTDALLVEPAGTGSVLCGSNLGSFDIGCDGGQVLGHSAPGMTVNLECIGGTFQCGGV